MTTGFDELREFFRARQDRLDDEQEVRRQAQRARDNELELRTITINEAGTVMRVNGMVYKLREKWNLNSAEYIGKMDRVCNGCGMLNQECNCTPHRIT